jgi:hypothetical protein
MFSTSAYTNIIITIVFSLFIILICQHLWNYILDHFSTKKTKNLVNGQLEKYKKLMGIIKESEEKPPSYISKIEKEEMNQDLENFLKDQLSI